jgi:hypothetical protein
MTAINAASVRLLAVILGYHGIADVDARHHPIRLFVAPSRLRAQIQRLQRRGYRFLSMADLAAELGSGAPPHRTCALTSSVRIDDDRYYRGLLSRPRRVPVGGRFWCPLPGGSDRLRRRVPRWRWRESCVLARRKG